MSSKTTYTCDLCQSTEDVVSLKRVERENERYILKEYQYVKPVRYGAHICSDCVRMIAQPCLVRLK